MNLPPYRTFPTLTGSKVALRQIELSDVHQVIAISYYDAIQAISTEEAQEMQRKIYEDYKEGNSIHWGIWDNSTGKIVGTCGYYRGFANKHGELGCVLLPKYQRQGFMTPAMLLAINYGFNSMKLERIWAATNPDNYSAIKLLERLDFKKITTETSKELHYELYANL